MDSELNGKLGKSNQNWCHVGPFGGQRSDKIRYMNHLMLTFMEHSGS